MTTPDAQNAPARDDAQGPASTATTLSRLLGGWTRAQTARHPDAQRPAAPGAPGGGDGAESDGARAPEAAESDGARAPEAAGPDGGAVEPAAPDPAGAGPVGGLGGAGPVHVSAPEAAAEDTEEDEDGDDVEEHVFATADPCDFADDAGPQ